MDWLTAATTLAPSIIAALTLLFAYLQSKDNNRSKRYEIAFEKRLEAFSEIVKLISIYKFSYDRLRALVDNNNDIIQRHGVINNEEFITFQHSLNDLINNVATQHSKFIMTYHEYKVLFPSNIDEKIQVYYDEVIYKDDLSSYIPTTVEFVKHINTIKQKQDKYTKDIVDEMQRFMMLR
jgi:hypothetical protein